MDIRNVASKGYLWCHTHYLILTLDLSLLGSRATFLIRWAGPDKPFIILCLCELEAGELLLSQLGFLAHLSQHLVHHAEQRTAYAQQLIQEHIVMWVASDVGTRSRARLIQTSQQLSRQHTHSPTSTPRPTQASPNQGNQGTWGLCLDSACCGVAPSVQRQGCDAVLIILPALNTEETERHN